MRCYFEQHSLRLVRERVDVRGAELPDRLRGAADVYRAFRALYSDEPAELFVCFTLNTRHEVTGHRIVTRGILDASLIHPREVFHGALLANAAAVILAHNHPSGDPQPSPEDRAVTRAMVEAGKILGVPCLDHVVIGRDGYISAVAT